MDTPIYLTGSGQTRFGEWWDCGLRDLMEEAVEKAIDSSPCTSLDIDMVIVANMLAEQTNGQAQLGALASSLLPHRPPALRVEAACGSGSVALHTACGLLESGRAETILVVGVEKMTDLSPESLAAALMGAGDSEKDVPSGVTFPGIFGDCHTHLLVEDLGDLIRRAWVHLLLRDVAGLDPELLLQRGGCVEDLLQEHHVDLNTTGGHLDAGESHCVFDVSPVLESVSIES